MLYLISVTLIWAFSFGIIGSRLAGLDPNFSAMIRLALAFLCFLPFLRLSKFSRSEKVSLLAIGAGQFGLMYVAYMRAFAYLPAHLVALFSIFTPLYILTASDLLERCFNKRLLVCGLLSVGGAALLKYNQPSGDIWIGFILMQVANIAFGIGQLSYQRWRRARPQARDRDGFALMYLGGTLFAGLACIVLGPGNTSPTTEQWNALLFLGLVASGGGFFLWNKGATRTSTGTLATFNNALVPVAMFVSFTVFGEAKEVTGETWRTLAAGSLLIVGAIAWTRQIAVQQPFDKMSVDKASYGK